MNNLYLILHKVRGEPAFDIAEPVTIGDEEGWIIPTSGHRAYPSRVYNIPLLDQDMLHNLSIDLRMPPDLSDYPDHYASESTPHITLTTASALLAKLGLGSRPIKRRKI